MTVSLRTSVNPEGAPGRLMCHSAGYLQRLSSKHSRSACPRAHGKHLELENPKTRHPTWYIDDFGFQVALPATSPAAAHTSSNVLYLPVMMSHFDPTAEITSPANCFGVHGMVRQHPQPTHLAQISLRSPTKFGHLRVLFGTGL